jgi:AAA+ ATPase superfamily predicted ATPase
MKIVGRENEIIILNSVLKSSQSEMVAVYGRRRVGKTYLVRNCYKKELIFSISGMHNATQHEQLINFSIALKEAKKSRAKSIAPSSWIEAFEELKDFIASQKTKTKKVLFFDELPWLDTPKSNFLHALDLFWNSWATTRNDIVLVICGSAASWIIKKILNDKGGLHNRVTKRIRLMPFTLRETELFFKQKQIKMDRYSITQLYMAIGGIPFYLNEVQKGKSVAQNIEQICFSKDGLLQTEFQNLYKALFNNSDKHVRIIKALAASHQGLTRNAIIKKAKLNTGGSITILLNELQESGFITEIKAQHHKVKNNIFRLTDEYSLFYIKFIEPNLPTHKNTWIMLSKESVYKSWCGYAFENCCFKHSEEIKIALGISGIHTNIFSWQSEDAQIDMLIDRDDRSVNICEIKFYNTMFEINKTYYAILQRKLVAYQSEQKMNKNYFITLLTTFGVKQNYYSNTILDNVLTLDHLF